MSNGLEAPAVTEDPAMLVVEGLTRRFGSRVVVRDLGFSVRRGEILGLLGPNGAGKTTTLRMIVGALVPDGGRVRVDGIDVASRPKAAQRRLGYLPESVALYDELTVAQFLRFTATARGLAGRARAVAVESAVARVDLGMVLDQPIEILSKGFRRRVGLAQALLHDPDLLVLDEPTDGLDPNQKHDMRRFLVDMAADTAIVISTHILEEVEAVCTRSAIIAAGRLVADSTPSELKQRSIYNGAAVVVIAARRAEPIAARLRAMPEVACVLSERDRPGRLRLVALPVPGAGLAAPVAALAGSEGEAIASWFVEEGRLDDVFRRLTGAPPGDGDVADDPEATAPAS